MKTTVRMKKGIMYVMLVTMLWLTGSTGNRVAAAGECDHTIGTSVSTADGWKEYKEVQPGQTVCLAAGQRGPLKIRNFAGTADKPITFINSGGRVVINSSSWYGIMIENSQHLRLTGSGSQEKYGIKIAKSGQHGIRAGWKSSDFEIDHVEVSNVASIGIHAQTVGVCSDGSTNDYDYDRDGKERGDLDDVVNRSNFVQHNTILHDNYLHQIGTEGVYLGNSHYGQEESSSCASGSEKILNPVLKGVHIYNNRVEETGWDGLQVGSAIEECSIHHNFIYRDSLANRESQQSGIMNNPGSVCDIYSNFIKDGGSRGIYIQGNGGNQVYNNMIIDPSQSHSSSGITVGGSNRGGDMAIYNNTILNPAEKGINYRNGSGTNNVIDNNLIINPGDGANQAIDTNDRTNVEVGDNYVTMQVGEVGFVDPVSDNYTVSAGSPAAGYGSELKLEDLEGGEEPGPDNGPYLQVEAAQSQVYPGETVTVKVTLNEVKDLYGVQLNCQVDPGMLAWAGGEFAEFFTSPLIGAKSGDAASGEWLGAISQKNPAPALSGSGLVVSLSYTAVAVGESKVTCDPLASDRDGFELQLDALSDQVTVLDPNGGAGQLEGQISYQGRLAHSGIVVTVSSDQVNEVGQTDEAGRFEVSDLPNNSYSVRADGALHLARCTEANVVDGQVTSLLPITLVGGDTDDDEEIRINDATLIGSNIGLSGAAMDPRADINADGQVNIQDLSILGGNFGKSGCQEWLSSEQLS